MKILSAVVIAALLASGSLFANSSEVKLGHSREALIQLLGEPIGTLELGSKLILMYPQGDVVLNGDTVSEINLMSDVEFAAQEERKRLEREEWLMQQEKLSAARKQEGEQIKVAKLQSGAFAALPAKQRLDYWRSFQMSYPEVDVTNQITQALDIHQTDLEEQATERRIAMLEARVSKAEAALQAAMDENEQLKYQLGNRNYSFNDTYVSGPRFYPVYYPTNRIIIRSDGNRSARHPERCPDTERYTRPDRDHRANESIAERAKRILNSDREL